MQMNRNLLGCRVLTAGNNRVLTNNLRCRSSSSILTQRASGVTSLFSPTYDLKSLAKMLSSTETQRLQARLPLTS